MRKVDELARGCISRAADDEPVFVLRAQDKLAPALVRLWATLADLHGLPLDKVEEAERLATEMQSWHRQKWPD